LKTATRQKEKKKKIQRERKERQKRKEKRGQKGKKRMAKGGGVKINPTMKYIRLRLRNISTTSGFRK